MIKDYGKQFYYITPDYAYGHTLEAGMIKACAPLGGVRVGGDLTPLGTTDFSSYLIKAQAANPDVIMFLTQGDDMMNALKQAVQFGLDKRLHLAGAQQELESLEGLPPEARIGSWMMEWYWKQPGVPHVAEFVETIKKQTGTRPDGAHMVRLRLGLDLRASPRPPPSRSTRSRWRRRCKASNCRRKSRCRRTRPSIGRPKTS